MRLTVVQRVTGVNSRTLRSLWHEINQNNPSSGRLKDTVSNSIRSYEEATKLAAFISIYKTVYHNKNKCTFSSNSIQFDTQTLLETWDEFKKLNNEININLAYYAIRDISAGIVQFTECRVCNANFIYDHSRRITEICPFCKITAQKKGLRERTCARKCSQPYVSGHLSPQLEPKNLNGEARGYDAKEYI